MDNHIFTDWEVNGHDHEHTSGLAELESPFSLHPEQEADSEEATFTIDLEGESPFYTNVADEHHHDAAAGPEEEAFVRMLDEISDDEFVEGVVDLANEADRYLHEHLALSPVDNETADVNRQEELLMSHFQPLAVGAEQFLDRLAHEFANRETDQLTEGEIDSIFERYQSSQPMGNPVFEDFFKKLWRKAKKVAKRAVNVVKKGISVVKKLNPLNLVFGRLKRMIRPFLTKIIRRVISRLPRVLQQPARMLARRFGIRAELELSAVEIAERELADPELEGETALPAATPDFELLEREFDLRLTEQFFAETDQEAERVFEAFASNRSDLQEAEDEARFQRARQRLVDSLKTATTAEEVRPHVEEFIGAALTVLRWGVRLIGRKRVVNFVSKLLTKLIAKLIGPRSAAPLARAIVDKGFGLLGLELTEQEADTAAADTIAQVVEEVTMHIVGLSDEVLENEELLEQETYEHFSRLVASNFPSNMVQEELRESERAAAWVQLPKGRRRKLYKKYGRVLNLNLTHDQIRGVKTFGGNYLKSFLSRRHGFKSGGTLKVRVHLYEAMRGGWLSRISMYEKGVPGLGSPRRAAWSQLHPLTTEAAGRLLGNARLGKDVSSRWLNSRHRIVTGQRFYYIEVLGSADRPAGRPTPNDPRPLPGIPQQPGVARDEAWLKLDFTRSTMTLALMVTEPKAAEITRRLRANDYFGAATTFRTSIRDALNNILLRHVGRQVKIVMELSEERYLEEHFGGLLRAGGRLLGGAAKSALKGVVDRLLKRLVTQAEKALANHLRRLRADFIRAQENPAQGLTIHLVFVDMPGMAIIRTFFKIKQGKPVSLGDVTGSVLPAIPTPDMRVFPGRKPV